MDTLIPQVILIQRWYFSLAPEDKQGLLTNSILIEKMAIVELKTPDDEVLHEVVFNVMEQH